MNTGPYTQAQVLLIEASEDEAALQATGNPDAVPWLSRPAGSGKAVEGPDLRSIGSFELTHNLLRLADAARDLGEALACTPVPLSDLNDFAVEYRYELLFQHMAPSAAELIKTVRLIREHVVARIAALSAAP